MNVADVMNAEGREIELLKNEFAARHNTVAAGGKAADPVERIHSISFPSVINVEELVAGEAGIKGQSEQAPFASADDIRPQVQDWFRQNPAIFDQTHGASLLAHPAPPVRRKLDACGSVQPDCD